jgi:hypothetical protein
MNSLVELHGACSCWKLSPDFLAPEWEGPAPIWGAAQVDDFADRRQNAAQADGSIWRHPRQDSPMNCPRPAKEARANQYKLLTPIASRRIAAACAVSILSPRSWGPFASACAAGDRAKSGLRPHSLNRQGRLVSQTGPPRHRRPLPSHRSPPPCRPVFLAPPCLQRLESQLKRLPRHRFQHAWARRGSCAGMARSGPRRIRLPGHEIHLPHAS